jgi:short-subunit dehydrogenase
MAAYGASKRAVTYFTKALLKDTKGTPVQVGLLSPGIVATDLLTGDYDGQPEQLAKAKRIFNILGDRVETVTPWLADRVLATSKTGAHVQWLTRPKAFGRFATAAVRKRDIFGTAA